MDRCVTPPKRLPHLPGVSHLHVNKTLSKVQMLGSDFKQERKRERKKRNKTTTTTTTTNKRNKCLRSQNFFSIISALSHPGAIIARTESAGDHGTTQRAPCDSCTNIPWLDSDLKYALKVKEIWWSSQQKRNLSS